MYLYLCAYLYTISIQTPTNLCDILPPLAKALASSIPLSEMLGLQGTLHVQTEERMQNTTKSCRNTQKE